MKKLIHNIKQQQAEVRRTIKKIIMSTGGVKFAERKIKAARGARAAAYAASGSASRKRQVAMYRAGYSPRELASLELSHGYPAGAINMEFKSIDVAGTNAANTTPAFSLLDGCAQGSDINQRVGRQITLRSVQLRGYEQSAAAAGVDQVHRIVLVYDRQSNGVAPVIGDILQASSVTAPRNLNNRRRFKILMDRIMVCNATAESGSNVTWQFYRKLRHPVEFNAGNAGTVADIQSGSLYLMVVTNIAPGAGAGDSYWNARVRFTDV